MPFRPWGICGEPRRGPGLVGILWDRGHAAHQGSQAARSIQAMPAARRAGQDDRVRASALPPVGSCAVIHTARTTGTCAPSRRPACPASRRTATRSPRWYLACAPREKYSPADPLTRASTRNTLLPTTQAPATASDHAADVTNKQHAPNADSVLSTARTGASCAARRTSTSGAGCRCVAPLSRHDRTFRRRRRRLRLEREVQATISHGIGEVVFRAHPAW